MYTSLFTTKLKRPPVTSDLVARPRLVARLNERPERGLTVISAPAGYGKTTLLSEWCEAQDLAIAWVSLDENDNPSDLFLHYIVAALKVHHPASFVELGAMLATGDEIAPTVLVTSFVNQIDEWGQRILLVLDDYQAIKTGASSEFFSILIQNLPPNLHLVLAARTDPSLPLTRARAQGNLVELRTSDLRFTLPEVKAFLQRASSLELDPATVALVDKQLEGWAAGLRLAALSMSGQETLTNPNAWMTGGRRWMTEYLMDQVLLQQPTESQNFLLRTSLVDRFSIPLAEVLLAGIVPEPSRVLQEIQRANLFLIPLDDEHKWFRYHHLFQELLRERLRRQSDNVEIAALHQRASHWFNENGLIDEAIQHALEGGEPTSAARMIEANAHVYFNREDRSTIERWLGQLTPEVFNQHPLLQMVRAWTWWMQWKLETLAPFLEQMGGRLERGELDIDNETEALVRGYFAGLQAALAYFSQDVEHCLQYTQQALEHAPLNYRFMRGWDYFFQATSLARLGKHHEAIGLLNHALERDGYQPDQFTARLLLAKVDVYTWNNEHHKAVETCEHMLNLALKGNLPESVAWARDGLGILRYEWNQLERVLPHFTQGIELRHIVGFRAVHGLYAGLAVTYQAMGFPEQANRVAASARELALETQLPTLPYVSTALEARLALMQDDLETAVRRASTLLPEITDNFYLFFEVPELTKLQVLIAESSPASLQAAQEFHQALVEFCEQQHCKYYMTNLLALGALLQAAQGRETDALETLRNAVESARSTERVRVFVDLGKPMRVLFGKLASRAPNDKYLGQILATFKPEKAFSVGGKQDNTARSVPRPSAMVNPLTHRERDVLNLLRAHLSNKEIASKLVISPLTVDKHTQNIYSKLGVNDRRNAVDTALALGILTP